MSLEKKRAKESVLIVKTKNQIIIHNFYRSSSSSIYIYMLALNLSKRKEKHFQWQILDKQKTWTTTRNEDPKKNNDCFYLTQWKQWKKERIERKN